MKSDWLIDEKNKWERQKEGLIGVSQQLYVARSFNCESSHVQVHRYVSCWHEIKYSKLPKITQTLFCSQIALDTYCDNMKVSK